MDNKTKEILQKFSTQRVELGLLQDIESDYDFLLNKIKPLEDKFYDALSDAKNYQKFLIKDSSKLENVQKDIISAKRKLKEIGLDKQVSALDKMSSKVDAMVKDIERLKNIKL